MTLLSTTGYNMTIPTIYLFAGQLGASVEEIGLIAALGSFVRLFLRVPAGAASDRFGGKSLMQLGCVASSTAHIVGGVLLGTAGTTLIFSIGITAAAGIYGSRTSAGVSLYLLICSVSFFLAPLLCSILLLGISIRYTYIVACAISLGGIAASGLISKRTVKKQPIRLVQSLTGVLRNRMQMDGLILQAAFSILFIAVFVFFPLYGESELHLSSSEISAVFSVYSFAMIVIRVALPRLMIKVGDKILVSVSFLEFSGLMILLPFLRELPVLFLVMFVTGVAHGMVFPTIATIVAKASKPTELGLANALNMAIGDIVGIVGPLPITALITACGFNALYIALAVGFAAVATYVVALTRL
jgi:MFS family permease